jgi:methylenetetrahydrofolate dehydrogenase (NADP+)/methenyltetrahydrofolate cyclohydrolase
MSSSDSSSMIIDGKQLAGTIEQRIQDTVRSFDVAPSLGIIYLGENPVIERFVARKIAFGARVGITVAVCRTLEESAAFIAMHDGIVVQLPVPAEYLIEDILSQVPWQKDVDVLKKETEEKMIAHAHDMFPPVAGAIRALCIQQNVSLSEKKIVVIGNGRLVGAPVSAWLTAQGIAHTVVTRADGDIAPFITSADVVISGAGVPSLITPTLIHDGMYLFDAGTSESGGKLRGDIDPECYASAALATPVPGGIGPLTIAVLFDNLIKMYARKS